ncbi:inorganic pyrophosphatase family protein, putative [Ichthyophthirius multifiliis]|uniref:inorganic diphosphatase n=1 Tax=Ichthyophthirius multifiliis TaxID=5932 RepID=G0R1V1_ICHMU|nr:inorganic pyrophosphatase family protein, putative [Ichthyophthirius multifiliis]EGR28560.1 inorganic pyrophosphatase family protein, putative [Ichthyophthirius multifiliis]|eukprot:XP_004029796.1 inorganic pyrophosphatase family protein, putative [Ichthyophthirius multifiliis]
MDWGKQNLAIILSDEIFLWNDGNIVNLLKSSENKPTSLQFLPSKPNILAIGFSDSSIQLWDTEKGQQFRTMKGHFSRVGSLSWNPQTSYILSSGSRDSQIINHDIRQQKISYLPYKDTNRKFVDQNGLQMVLKQPLEVTITPQESGTYTKTWKTCTNIKPLQKLFRGVLGRGIFQRLEVVQTIKVQKSGTQIMEKKRHVQTQFLQTAKCVVFYGIQTISNQSLLMVLRKTKLYYGIIIKQEGDDDPLDIVDLSLPDKKTGDIYQVNILGCFCLIDQGEVDWKIITINKQEALQNKIESLKDIEYHQPGRIKSIKNWFKFIKVYDGKKPNIIHYNEQIFDQDRALEVIHENHIFWKQLFDKNLNKTTHLGRALLSMVQLGSNVSYEYEDLFNAINDLKNSLYESRNIEKDLYEKQEITHNNIIYQFQAKIQELNEELNKLNITLNHKLDEQENENKNLEKQKIMHTDTLNQIDSIKLQIDQLNQKFNDDQNNLQTSIEALEQAIVLLRQSQIHLENSQLSGLVQIRKQYQDLSQKLTQVVKNFSKDVLLIAKPALSVLAQLNSETEQSTILLAISVLVDVSQYLNQGHNQLKVTYQDKIQFLTNELTSQQKIEENLRTVIIPNIEMEIISLLDLVDSLNVQIKETQNNLDEENRLWDLRTERHNILIKKFNQEIEIVEQAIDIKKDKNNRSFPCNINCSIYNLFDIAIIFWICYMLYRSNRSSSNLVKGSNTKQV